MESKIEENIKPVWNQLLADKPVQDFLIWSIINFVLFGWAGWQVSALSLIFSLTTRDSMRENNEEKARKYSKLSLIFNCLSTLKGLIIILTKMYFLYKYFHKE